MFAKQFRIDPLYSPDIDSRRLRKLVAKTPMPYSDDSPRRYGSAQPAPAGRASAITFAVICVYLVACVLIGVVIAARRHAPETRVAPVLSPVRPFR